MNVLVFGKTGQVAQELRRRCPSSMTLHFLGRDEVDLSHYEKVEKAISFMRPEAVINAAAWTNVDEAETAEDIATRINGVVPGIMAQTCARLRIPFLHVSTDYVFDGSGHLPRKPDDETSPLNAYGRSKLKGEIEIRKSNANYLVLRTSWVFSAHGKNFMKTVLRLAQEKAEINVVSDQMGGPTPASALADALIHAARLMVAGQVGGIYHYAGSPDVIWSDFARHIIKVAGLRCEVRDIKTVDFVSPIRRPLNSRLDCSTFERDFSVPRPDWRKGVVDVLNELSVNLLK